MTRIIAAAVALAAIAQGEAPHQISNSTHGAYEASLTAVGNKLVASWYDTRDGHPEIYMRVLDDRGRPAGPERRVTRGAPNEFEYEPDVAAVRNDVAMAWYERNTTTNTYRAKLALVGLDGRIIWQHALSADGHDGKNPVVRVAHDEVLVAWLEVGKDMPPEVRARWFDRGGHALAPAQRVGAAGKTTWNLNAAIDPAGRAWVVFDATAGTKTDELFLASVGKTSSTLTRLTADDGKASKYPDIAFSGTDAARAALTWFDEKDGNQEVYLLVSDVGALVEGLESRAARVTNTPGDSIGAYLAWNGDVLGLAWCDNSIERQHEVYMSRFDDHGAPIGAAIRVTENPSDSLIPAIRPWRDGFALVWNEFVAGRGGGHAADGRSEVWAAFVPKSAGK